MWPCYIRRKGLHSAARLFACDFKLRFGVCQGAKVITRENLVNFRRFRGSSACFQSLESDLLALLTVRAVHPAETAQGHQRTAKVMRALFALKLKPRDRPKQACIHVDELEYLWHAVLR